MVKKLLRGGKSSKTKQPQRQEEGEWIFFLRLFLSCFRLVALCSGAGEEVQGPQSEEQQRFTPLVPSVFSASRCLTEACAAIDSASCERAVANGGD